MEQSLQQAMNVMLQEPQATAAVAVFLGNFICAMNESLRPSQRMYPGPRSNAGMATQHRAPGTR
jgi:hypothetical protein